MPQEPATNRFSELFDIALLAHSLLLIVGIECNQQSRHVSKFAKTFYALLARGAQWSKWDMRFTSLWAQVR